MDARTAAAFLQLGAGSLRRLLAREGVRPVELGLRLRRWRRSDLESLAERLGGRGLSKDGEAVEAALDAVARRAGRQGRPPRRASGDP